MKREVPFDIPAGTTEELEFAVQTFSAGGFESQIHFYLDDLGLREEIITVHGTAVIRAPSS